MSLQGRVALVTGAAQGIGRGIAEKLAADGADLALIDVNAEMAETEAAIRAHGQRVASAAADVSQADAVAAALSALTEALGPIDSLVNNAGLTKNIAPVGRMAHDDWQRELAVNLTGPFNLINALVPGMAERGFGRIVNISSVAARGGLHYQAGYAASKKGLLGLTHNVTLEYARYGVTCNAVLPGIIETEVVKGMPALIRQAAIKASAARRLGRVEEVADLVAFLASDKAGYINGAEIDIDGGSRLLGLSLGSRSEIIDRTTLEDGGQ